MKSTTPAVWRLTQFVADEGVDRFALGAAKVNQLLQLGGRLPGEGTILQGGRIDVDVERRTAQSRESRQYADAAVADDVEIAVFAGAPRQHDDFGAYARTVQRHFGGTAQPRLDGRGPQRLLVVRRLGQFVRRHDAVEGGDVFGHHR